MALLTQRSAITMKKVTAAHQLLPLYNHWHLLCVATHGGQSPEVILASDKLMMVAAQYKHLAVPQKIQAAVGRWVAKVLKRTWTTDRGVVLG